MAGGDCRERRKSIDQSRAKHHSVRALQLDEGHTQNESYRIEICMVVTQSTLPGFKNRKLYLQLKIEKNVSNFLLKCFYEHVNCGLFQISFIQSAKRCRSLEATSTRDYFQIYAPFASSTKTSDPLSGAVHHPPVVLASYSRKRMPQSMVQPHRI